MNVKEANPGSRLAAEKPADDFNQAVQQARARILAAREPTLEGVVPLYISNHCDGSCSVCAMRRGNRGLKRVIGSEDEIRNQLRILKDIEGFTAVTVVTGELLPGVDRKNNLATVQNTVEHAFTRGFEKVFLNMGALTDSEIDSFALRFGVSAPLVLCVFQETYNRVTYGQVFGNDPGVSPKADFGLRLSSLQRWLGRGFRAVNLGILLGLGPADGDLRALALHAEELWSEGTYVALSIPRIRGQANAPCTVDDNEFRRLAVALASSCPFARVVLTTRENVSLLRDLLPIAGVISPGTSDVLPYTASGPIQSSTSTAQFFIESVRPRPSWVLESLGIGPGQIRYFARRS